MQMTRKVERYFWGVELGVVGLVAVLAGWTASSLFANAFMREGRVPTARSGGTWSVAGPGAPGSAGLRESGPDVQRRNLFCSSCTESVKPQTESPNKPAPRLKDAVLVATQVTSGDHDWTLASVRFPEAGQVRVLGHGSQVGDARITRVGATQVEFVRRGQSGVLHLLPGEAAPSRLSPVKRTESSGCPASIRPRGARRFSIDRALLMALIQGLSGTTRDVAVAPLHQGGKLTGLRLVRVRPRSVFHCLGLRSRDQVIAVNNQQLTSPDVMLTLMAQLPGARHISVSVMRRGRPLTFDYSVE